MAIRLTMGTTVRATKTATVGPSVSGRQSRSLRSGDFNGCAPAR